MWRDDTQVVGDAYMAAHPQVDWGTHVVLMELDESSLSEPVKRYRVLGHEPMPVFMPETSQEWETFNAVGRAVERGRTRRAQGGSGRAAGAGA